MALTKFREDELTFQRAFLLGKSVGLLEASKHALDTVFTMLDENGSVDDAAVLALRAEVEAYDVMSGGYTKLYDYLKREMDDAAAVA